MRLQRSFFDRLTVGAVASALLALASSHQVLAQAYPTRPVKLVVPLTAGGPGDVMGRYLAHKMGDALGQQVVVENRGGANMNIGAEQVAKAAPDGYTMLMNGNPMLVNPALYARMPYDNVSDFAPVTLVASFGMVLIANLDLPAKTAGELIALARSRPGQINYGSAGNGSLTHLAGEVLGAMASVQLVHVPYRGINEAVTDLIGGRVQLSFVGPPLSLPHVKAGKVRALGVTGAQRIGVAPDIPTLAEGGLPGYDVTPWYGIVAPARTPLAIIERWHRELLKILDSAETKERWAGMGADIRFNRTPEEFGAQIRDEIGKWAKVVRDAGVKMQ